MLTRLTIKQKILLGVCLSVLISALAVGGLNLTLLGGIMEKRLIEQVNRHRFCRHLTVR